MGLKNLEVQVSIFCKTEEKLILFSFGYFDDIPTINKNDYPNANQKQREIKIF